MSLTILIIKLTCVFVAFWDSSGGTFGIDKDTRQTLPTIGLAGAMFIYTPLDQYNTHGEIQSKGPLHLQITVYVSVLTDCK